MFGVGCVTILVVLIAAIQLIAFFCFREIDVALKPEDFKLLRDLNVTLTLMKHDIDSHSKLGTSEVLNVVKTSQHLLKTVRVSGQGSRIQVVKPTRHALLFTMDSIESYEENSKRGGASGEIIIRNSLEAVFRELNVVLDIKRSDRDFENANANDYDFIILDPW